jgi:long-chain fatty acid transport protein
MAAGFQLIEQSASGIGNSFAGSAAVAEDATTIFFNPAGMSRLSGQNVSAGFAAVRPSFKFSNSSSTSGSPLGPLSSNVDGTGDGGDGGSWKTLPNAYFSAELNKDLHFGVGIGAPFGLMTEFKNPWVGAAQSLKFDIKTINVNPSIAYRVSDSVALGLGVDWQRINVEYVKRAGAFDVPGSVPAPTNPFSPYPMPLYSSTAKLTGSDAAWGWNVGAMFTLSPQMRIGVSYRSAIQYSLTGNIEVTGSSGLLNAAGSSPIKADIKVPDTFILSAEQTIDDRWEMLGDLSRTGWSSINKVDIVRTAPTLAYASGTVAQTLKTDFRDTWRLAFGMNYKMSDAIKLKYGLAYDQTPVKGADTRLVSLPDNNRVWVSTGVKWMPAKDSALDLGTAYLFIKDAPINNDQRATNGGLVNGVSKDYAWILGAEYSMSF